METTTKVLIIGLDGATWATLIPWLETGSLPNLARLRQTGCWGELFSTLPPLSAPAWSTFATGKNPGKHSVFHFVRPNSPGKAKPEIVDSRSVKSATLWDVLGHHQRKVGLINVPMTYPPRPVNGFMITGLLTPPGAAVFTYPPELSDKLTDYQIDLERFITHKPFARDSDAPPRVEPSLELMQEFRLMMEKRARTALDLMRSEPWGMFMVVFTGTDRMGHYLWPYHREIDSDGSSQWQQIHQAVYNYYIRLDQVIGEMVQEAGKDSSVIVMSDHGMGPNYTKSVNWNQWLHQQGLLSVKSAATSFDGWLLRLKLPRDRIARLARKIPGLVSSRLVKGIKKAPAAALNTKQTQAHYKPVYNNVGHIYINLPDAEREKLRDDLIRTVKQVIDPDTGQFIVREAYRGEECYHGPYADGIPDIVLVMAPQYGSSGGLSHYSSIVTEIQGIRDPGGHCMEGIFIAKGPEIAPIPEALSNLNIQDITPTVLYLMGLPVPSDMDGRVLDEILKSETLQTRPITLEEPMGKWPSDEAAQAVIDTDSPSDDDLIEERLRALGYLE